MIVRGIEVREEFAVMARAANGKGDWHTAIEPTESLKSATDALNAKREEEQKRRKRGYDTAGWCGIKTKWDKSVWLEYKIVRRFRSEWEDIKE